MHLYLKGRIRSKPSERIDGKSYQITQERKVSGHDLTPSLMFSN